MFLKRILKTSLVRFRYDVGSFSVYLRYVFESPWYVFLMSATSVRLPYVFGNLRCNFDRSSWRAPDFDASLVKGSNHLNLTLTDNFINVADLQTNVSRLFELDFSSSRYNSLPLMCVCAGDIRETMVQKLRHITWKWRVARTSVLTWTPARDLKPRKKRLSYRSMTSLNFSPTLFTGRKKDFLCE